MVLRIYGDLLSQPTRAVLIFARANNIDHVLAKLDIRNLDHKKPEFLAINPMGKVPAIDDDGFKLFESHAILRYLATSRSAADHWYPKNARRRAEVDCILDWHHANLREGTRTLVREKVFGKDLGLKTNEEKVKQSKKLLVNSLNFIENVWLNEDGSFLCGSPEISVADLSLVCEIKQILLLDRLDIKDILGPREKLRKWIQAVEDNLTPHFNEVHSLITEVSRKIHAKQDAEKSSL